MVGSLQYPIYLYFLNICNFFSFLTDGGKSPWAKDLFIKFESIGDKVMTFVLTMLVGMLSQPTLLLFFTFLLFSLSREWIFDENYLTLEFDHHGNFQMLLSNY